MSDRRARRHAAGLLVRLIGVVALFAGLLLQVYGLQVPTSDVLLSDQVWTRVTPSVLWCGSHDSAATVEVHIVGRTDVVGVTILGPNETLSLYDDGTHGDVVAGDSTFTLAGVRPFCHTGLSLKYGGTVGSWSGALEATLADGRTVVAERRVSIGFAQPRYRKSTDVVYYPNGLSATSHAFFIQDIEGVVFDGYPVSRTDPRDAARRALEVFYSVMPDAFDFAVVMAGRTMYAADGFAELGALTLRTANDVEHIGVPLFNDAASCGSAGRLRGAVLAPFGAVDVLDSEIVNVWGAEIGLPFGIAHLGETGSAFWDATSDVGGQLASYLATEQGRAGYLAANEDGTWRLVSPAENARYAPLELYIMGLLEAAQVPPIHLLSDLDLTDAERITAGAVRTITFDDIVAAHGGTRSPDPSESPRAFSVAFVVVQDEPFADAEYAYYSLLAHRLATQDPPEEFDMLAPFFWATGGRAQLTVRLPVGARPILPR